MRRANKKCTNSLAAVLAGILAISLPLNVLAENPSATEEKNGEAFVHTITEAPGETGETSVITLELTEEEGVTLSQVILPDGTAVRPEEENNIPGFRQSTADGIKNTVTYEAHENGAVTFKVRYRLPVSDEGGTAEEQEREIVYEVSGVKDKADAAQAEEEMQETIPPQSTEESSPETQDSTPKESKAEGTKEDVPAKEKAAFTDSSIAAGEISLTPGQAIEQDNLIPGQDELINLTIRFELAGPGTDRKIRLDIPEGFEAIKVPDAADIESVSSIALTDNKLEISLYDSANKTAAFDIQVRQDKALLYQNAENGTKTYEFYMEGLDGEQSVFTKSLKLQVQELGEARYSVECNPEQTWDNIRLPASYLDGASTEYKLKVSKAARTKRDGDFRIQVPKRLTDGAYMLATEITQVTVNHTVYAGSELAEYFEILDDGACWSLAARTKELQDAMQNGYTEDTVTELVIKCLEQNTAESRLFTGKRYESSDMLAVFAGEKCLYESCLALDTTAFAETLQFVGHTGLQHSVQWTQTDVNGSVTVNIQPAAYNVEQAEVTLELPEEVRLTAVQQISGIEPAAVAAICTNKGREITEEELSGLPEDEYAQSIKISGTIPHHQRLSLIIRMHVRDTYPDGTRIESGSKTQMKLTADAADTGLQRYEEEIPFTITRKDKDNLVLRVVNNDGANARIGMKNQQIADIRLAGNGKEYDTQVYTDSGIIIRGQEALSLTDYVRFQYYGLPFTGTLEAVYRTNLSPKERTMSAPGGTQEMRFPLESGEYLTGLEIRCDALDICRGTGAYEVRVLLMADCVPEQLPADGTEVENRDFEMQAEFVSANTTIERVESGFTASFLYPADEEILSAVDMSKQQVESDDVNVTLAAVNLSPIDSEDRITYEQPVIDFEGTDPELLSMITGFRTSPYGVYFQWQVTTNKGREIMVSPTGNLSLQEDEYVTGLKMIWQNGSSFTPSAGYTVELLGSPQPYSRLSGAYLGDAYTDYAVNVSFAADNKERYEAAGRSAGISGKSEVNITGMESGAVTVSDGNVYQGKEFTVLMEQNFAVTNPAERSFCIKEPVFIIEVDARYTYEAGSARVGSAAAEVQWEEAKLSNGNSLLRIRASDYREIFQTNHIGIKIEFALRVRAETEPAKGVQPIGAVWTDFAETTAIKPEEGQALVRLSNTQTGELELMDELLQELYKWQPVLEGGQEILSISEMGVGLVAFKNETSGIDLTGHDGDTYGLKLSVLSDPDKSTRDWIIYIPVPKKGQRVLYGSGKESPASDFDMELIQAAELEDAPKGTEITYRMESASGYVPEQEVDDWAKVAMVKIRIPELKAGEGIYPVLYYQSVEKKSTGLLTAYAGGYFNTKMGDSGEYFYGEEGGYLPAASYSIIDYQVSGIVWEETGSKDYIFTESDKPLAGVSVTAKGEDGQQWSAVTDSEGAYTLMIPASGRYRIKLQTPVKGQTTYRLIKPDGGTIENSSKFNPDTKSTMIFLGKEDIPYLNAGLTAEVNIEENMKEEAVEENTQGESTHIQVDVGAVNGKIGIAKGSRAPDITGENVETAVLYLDTGPDAVTEDDVTIKYAARMHNRLSKITLQDEAGNIYTLLDKGRTEGADLRSGPEPEEKTGVGEVTAVIDEANGTIYLRRIAQSLRIEVEFKAEPTYKVSFYTEKGNPQSLYQVNDGLFSGSYVGGAPKEEPQKEGYTFKGYCGGQDTAEEPFDSKERIKDSDLSYYAIWEKNN